MKKLWEKGVSTNREIEDFTIGSDRELDLSLARYDILGTLAHATMLESIGILSDIEKEDLKKELLSLYKTVEEGLFTIEPGVEDVHSQVEKILTEKLGDAGKKVHTGRSRNDQVSVDLHLYIRDEIRKTVMHAGDLFNALMMLSKEHQGALMPGYTHYQVAMPASFGLWFASFAEDITDDMILLQGAFKVANQNPLGAAAGFGTSISLNRKLTSDLLGFESLRYNVMHAMMSRGRLEKITAQSLSSLAGTLARLAMDITMYMGQNYDFISFPEEYTTGSSIMPHKKNPDVFELIRAKCNRIKSLVTEVDLVTTNLPSGYHRDFQVLKENLMRAFSELQTCLFMAEKVLMQINIRKDILDDPVYKHISSVDKVNQLVMSGIPFREAYQEVARQIRNNDFTPEEKIEHTHEGSLGNLCLEEIRKKMDKRLEEFRFEAIDMAYKKLLQ
ncbi:MAG: argininosuccinate lyase [Bacteroidales bacterium]|nr:argininosuccinate lyase [Bacteroidales bacterium]